MFILVIEKGKKIIILLLKLFGLDFFKIFFLFNIIVMIFGKLMDFVVD